MRSHAFSRGREEDAPLPGGESRMNGGLPTVAPPPPFPSSRKVATGAAAMTASARQAAAYRNDAPETRPRTIRSSAATSAPCHRK